MHRSDPPDPESVTQYILNTYAGVETVEAAGFTFFFYGPDRMMPFATLGTEDDVYDRASDLDRPGVFRLNIGVSRDTYTRMFGLHPAAPGESRMVDTGHDFTALDQLIPHPVYAPQSWVCGLNPSALTFQTVGTLLDEAYERAVSRQAKREGT